MMKIIKTFGFTAKPDILQKLTLSRVGVSKAILLVTTTNVVIEFDEQVCI